MLKKDTLIGELPGTGEAYSLFFAIALPMVIEFGLTGLISAVNTAMVGSLGKTVVSAVGISGQLKNLMLCVSSGIGIGNIAVVSRRFGAEQKERANASFNAAMTATLLSSLLMFAVAYIFASPLLVLAGARDGVLSIAVGYFRILIISMPVQALRVIIITAQRGVGKTKVSMLSTVTSYAINVVGNYLLIGGKFFFPRLGSDGTAIASVIGYTSGFIVAVAFILPKSSYIRLNFKQLAFIKRDDLLPVLKIGGSATIELIATRVGALLFSREIARLGDASYAAHYIDVNLLTVVVDTVYGFSVAATTLTGKYLGKNRPDIAVMYGKMSQRMAIAVSVLVGIVFVLFRKYLAGLFIDDGEVILLAANAMLLCAAVQLVQSWASTLVGALRGAGDTKFTAAATLLTTTVLRVVLSVLFIRLLNLGLYGAWIAMLADSAVRLTVCYVRYRRGKWMLIRL